jgi:hypothetical protein
MALLEMTTDVNTVSVAVRGPVDRGVVDQLRSLLGTVATPVSPDAAMELDLREVTSFPRLGIAVLVSARRWFGERLSIRGNSEVLAMVEDTGLTRVLHLSV